jgi:hypothetical protein
VDVRISGNGSSSGDSIFVRIERRGAAGPAPLVLTAPAGSILSAGSASSQSMVVARVRGRMTGERTFSPSPVMTVSGGQPAVFVLEAYCAEFHKSNPSPNDTFELTAPDPGLACVLRRSAGLSRAAVQAAVWVHTDGVGLEQMRRRFRVSPAEYEKGKAAAAVCPGRGARR